MGLIQTPDVALNAATGQVTNSGGSVSPVGAVTGNFALLISATYDSDGGLLQIAFNGTMVNNNSSGLANCYYFVTIDNTSPAHNVTPKAYSAIAFGLSAQPNGGAVNFAGQFTDTPAAGSHTYRLFVASDLTPSANCAAINGDMSVTEIKR